MNFINRLKIQPQFLDKGNHNLIYAYSKYKEYCRVSITWKQLKNQNAWTGGGKATELMEIIASSSFFYSHYQGQFELAKNHPILIAWLEAGDDQPSDLEAWGFEAPTYDFTTLLTYLLSHGEDVKDKKGKNGKGKGKSKEENVEVKNKERKAKSEDKKKKVIDEKGKGKEKSKSKSGKKSNK